MHKHTCRCGNAIECNAPLVRNDDGIPPVVCILVVEMETLECDACKQRAKDDLAAQDAEEAVH